MKLIIACHAVLLLLLFSSLAFALSPSPSLSPSSGVFYRGPLACGAVITKNTMMINDVMNCSGYGLIIQANNIILDCKGHIIDGKVGRSSFGIFLNGTSNVIIRNCVVTQFTWGIYFNKNANNNTLTGNTVVNNNQTGITVNGNSLNRITDNVVSSNTHGIAIGGAPDPAVSTYNLISDNMVNNNSLSGIAIGGNSKYNTVAGNTLTNSFRGFWLTSYTESYDSAYNNLTNNTAYGNTYGFFLFRSAYNVFKDNTVSNNNNGFYLEQNSDFNSFSGNTIVGNQNGTVLDKQPSSTRYPLYNFFWSNLFMENGLSVYEGPDSINYWNSTKGNYWSDFPTNPGYPDHYEVGGPGDGIDWHPMG